jgi:cell division protein FtsQ
LGRGRNRRRVDRAQEAAAAGQRARAAGPVLGARGLLLLLGLSGWQAWRLLTTGEWLRIREIRFAGARAAASGELLDLSPVKRGDNLLLANVDAMARALLRHPWVAGVEIRRRWPPALEVSVRERRAVAMVDLGGLYLVDRDGQPFKRAAPGDGLDLPLVTGFTRDDYVQRRADVEPLLRSALGLAEDWKSAGLERALPLSEIHLDGAEGVTLYAGEEGLQVRLGGGATGEKLQRLAAVLRALRAEGKRAEVVLLDDRAHPDWVTVRPRMVEVARRAKGQADEPAP